MAHPRDINKIDTVPVIGNTLEWFSYDIKIIKKSFYKTIHAVPIIICIDFLLTLILFQKLDIQLLGIFTLVLSIITIPAVFLTYVMSLKKYKIRVP